MIAKNIKGELEQLIAKDKIQRVIEILKNIFEKLGKTELMDEIILLQGRYESNQRKIRRGLIPREEFNLINNDVRQALLSLLRQTNLDNAKGLQEYAPPNLFYRRNSILILIALILLGVLSLFIVLRYSNSFKSQLVDQQLKMEPGVIDIWETFSDHLYYFNAPFSFTKRDHIDFKRRFLSTHRNENPPIFEILFFKGKTKEEKEENKVKMRNFKQSLKEICQNDPEMKEIVLNQVEVKEVDSTYNSPVISFFLTQVEDQGAVAYLYIYENKMLELTPSPKNEEPSFGVLISEKNESIFGFKYSTYQTLFRDTWTSQYAHKIDLEELLE